jgi:hypothetical protein
MLLDDPIYDETYVGYLEQAVIGPFDLDHVAETHRTLAELIAPYATADVGETAFESAVERLTAHAYQRADAVTAFVSPG